MPPRPSLSKSLGELFATVLVVLALLATSVSAASSRQPTQIPPLAQAHAHNDYENDRPLLDALDHGFTSVEADVWLKDGELLVAHDDSDVSPGATLETLYLAPLAEQVRANAGSVHPGWEQPFHLLIDVKSDARPTYLAIHRALLRHQEMMTRFTPDGVAAGAVTVTISGNRDLDLMARQQVRFAGYDGRLSDLDGPAPAGLVPLISDDWSETFDWRGVGPMPESERQRLRDIVTLAHARGRKVRFWGTSDLPAIARRSLYAEALEAGVDYLESDHLTELPEVILADDPTPSRPLVDWRGTGERRLDPQPIPAEQQVAIAAPTVTKPMPQPSSASR